MQAKVKDGYRFDALTAATVNYRKGVWMPVPLGWEQRLLDGYSDYLDLRDAPEPEPVATADPGQPAQPSEVAPTNSQPFEPAPLDLTDEQSAALPTLEQDPAPSEPIAVTEPEPAAAPEPAPAPDAVLEAEAEADEQAAAAAEQAAAADRAAAAAKRAKKGGK